MDKPDTQNDSNHTECDTCAHCIIRTIRAFLAPHKNYIERDCGYDRTFLHCDNVEACNRYQKTLTENGSKGGQSNEHVR